MERQLRKERVFYLDLLRVLAMFGVIAIHMPFAEWKGIASTDYSVWGVSLFYHGIVRWAVPLFVMISGALFLDPDRKIDYKDLYLKKALHYVIIYLFWQPLQAIIIGGGQSLIVILASLISGASVYWFLVMLMGLYLTIPYLRKITEDTRLLNGFVGLSLIFTFAFPNLIKWYAFGGWEGIKSAESGWNHLNFHLTLGYVAYFVMGYYLKKLFLTVRARRVIYSLGLLGVAETVAITAYLTYRKNMFVEIAFDNFSICVMLQAIGLFVLIKYTEGKVSASSVLYRWIGIFAKYSFGVYLVHRFVIFFLQEILEKYFNSIIGVPIGIGIVFMISLVIVSVGQRIPILREVVS